MAYIIIWFLVFVLAVDSEANDTTGYVILSGVVALVVGSVYYAAKALIQFIF